MGKYIISLTAGILRDWTVYSSSSQCCHSCAAVEWWPPSSDSAVCLPLNDRNVECVCTDGSISFNMSSIPLFFLLSYFENHCNLSSSEVKDLCVFLCVCVWFSLTIWISIHTYTPVRFSRWHLSLLCVTSRPFLFACVHHLFCLRLLARVIMCVARVYFTV